MLIKGLLMGGLNQGEWLPYDEFYNSGAVDFDGYLYDVYVDDAKKGKAAGGLPIDFLSGETLSTDKYVDGFDIVKLYDEKNEKVPYDIAINADWNLYPRSYTSESTDQQDYLDLAKSLISQEGVENPETALKQVLHVDLDGDGTQEVFIAADNTIDDQFTQVKKGDNAILIFSKMVDGESGQSGDR